MSEFKKIMKYGEFHIFIAHVEKAKGGGFEGVLDCRNEKKLLWQMRSPSASATKSIAFDTALTMLDHFEHVNPLGEDYFRHIDSETVEPESEAREFSEKEYLGWPNVHFEKVRRVGGEWVAVDDN